jgi:hypothetical protein
MKDKKTPPSGEAPNFRRFSLFSRPLAQTLTQVVKPVYKKHGFAEHRILTEWDLIVGPELAAYSQPQKLTMPRGKKEGGTLYVLVAAGRALELQHLQPIILSKVATYFGYTAVARLHFTQSQTTLFRKTTAEKPKQKPVADEALIALTAQCEDEQLKNALLSLGAALAAVEK